VYFDATTKGSPERIEATNKSGTIVVEQSSGRVEASVLIKGFLFDKALMQEHFNENYMESSKFPKATFKGKIDNLTAVNFDKDGTYNATISGDLSLHGVTKQVKTTATFKVKGGKVSASANFNAALSDYGIDVPSVVADKLAKEAKISFAGDLEKMK
jgi:polyisoprenoid-binding protein YceI